MSLCNIGKNRVIQQLFLEATAAMVPAAKSRTSARLKLPLMAAYISPLIIISEASAFYA